MRIPALLALLATLVAPVSVLADEPDRVILSLEDFLELYEKNREPVEESPHDFAIASAQYRGRVVVEGDKPRSVTFRATLHVNVLRKRGWVRVRLLPVTTALQSATVGGVEVPVVIEDGYYTMVTDARGPLEVELGFAASVITVEGRSHVGFDLTPSGATSVELRVRSDHDLEFSVPQARLQSDEVRGDERTMRATLPSTDSLAIDWQKKVPVEAAQQARIYAEVFSLVSIGDGVMQVSATVNHTILFADVDRFEIEVPSGMTVLDTRGAGIRDWTLRPDGHLEIALNYAARGEYQVELSMEKAIGEQTQNLSAPIVKPIGVERVKGWLGVEVRGNLEVGGGEITNATVVDVRSLPAQILGITSQPVLLGYKYLGSDATVPLAVARHDDVDVLVTLIDQVRARTMWTPQGRRLTSVKYQLRNNRRQFLRLRLPEGAELWSASVGGRAVQPARAADAQVMIPLVRSQSSGGSLAAFAVEVVYVESAAPTEASGQGQFAATLPSADVPSTYVAWTVYSPSDARIRRRTVEGTLTEVEALSNPIPEEDMFYIQTETPQVQAQAVEQTDAGAMGTGAVPVPVSLPLSGVPVYFEKLLALGEPLDVAFEYRGLRTHTR